MDSDYQKFIWYVVTGKHELFEPEKLKESVPVKNTLSDKRKITFYFKPVKPDNGDRADSDKGNDDR